MEIQRERDCLCEQEKIEGSSREDETLTDSVECLPHDGLEHAFVSVDRVQQRGDASSRVRVEREKRVQHLQRAAETRVHWGIRVHRAFQLQGENAREVERREAMAIAAIGRVSRERVHFLLENHEHFLTTRFVQRAEQLLALFQRQTATGSRHGRGETG
jgi:hypothetical protein